MAVNYSHIHPVRVHVIKTMKIVAAHLMMESNVNFHFWGGYRDFSSIENLVDRRGIYSRPACLYVIFFVNFLVYKVNAFSEECPLPCCYKLFVHFAFLNPHTLRQLVFVLR